MADIDVSKIKLPGDNNDYILKDATARADAPKVTQNNTTDNNYYRLLLSNSSNDNNETAIAKKSGNLTFSPGYSSLILNGGDTISRIVVQHSNNNSSQPVANAAEIKLSDSCNDGGYLDGDTGSISLYTCFNMSVLRAYYTHNNNETSKDILKTLYGSTFSLGDCLVKEYIDSKYIHNSSNVTVTSTNPAGSGNIHWEYTKYDNGKLEISGYLVMSMTNNITWSSWGSGYYYSLPVSLTYPIAFVGESPAVTVNVILTGGQSWVGVSDNNILNSLTKAPSINVYRFTTLTTKSFYLNIHAVGKWK